MKKGLALEYIVKFIIMLTAAAIVIMLMWNFYNDIKGNSIIDGDNKVSVKTELVESSFTSQSVAKYIKSCWGMTGSNYDGDIVCYILKGSFFGATPASVLNAVPEDLKRNVVIEVESFAYVTSVIIEFKDLGNKIIVSG